MIDTPGIDAARVSSEILDSLGAPDDRPWYAAYSGGLDSTVLLHLLVRICRDAGIALIALHADHGLHDRSRQWRQRCERQCLEWGVEFRGTRLTLTGDDTLGPEGRARAARYRWFRDTAGEDAWLFTAHHRRDQAETVLERLTRGSGPRGLRGILPLTRMHDMNVVRPLLDVPREAIQAYAGHHCLGWVTDDSNLDTYFTRNYLRNHVLPVLKERWPGIETALGRTARVMADAQRILDEDAQADLAQLDDCPVRGDPSLDVAALRALVPERRRNALRFWVERETGVSLGFARLDRLVHAVAQHPDDSGGLSWPPVDLRLFRDRLYLVQYGGAPADIPAWDLESALRVDEGMVLRPREAKGRGLKKDAVAGGVQVTFRRGGEKCRLPGRRHRHTLKNLLQDAGVPPWQRARIPLILVNDDIAAIPGLTCCDPYAAAPDETGVDIEVRYT